MDMKTTPELSHAHVVSMFAHATCDMSDSRWVETADGGGGACLISNADPLLLNFLFGDLFLVRANKLPMQLVTHQLPTLLHHAVKAPCTIPHFAGQEERGNRNELHTEHPTRLLGPKRLSIPNICMRTTSSAGMEAYYSVRRLEGVLVIVLLHIHLGSGNHPYRPAHQLG